MACKGEENFEAWRRACGCMRTSDKLKQMLKVFPEPPPPTPLKSATPTSNMSKASCPVETNRCVYLAKAGTHFLENESCGYNSGDSLQGLKEDQEVVKFTTIHHGQHPQHHGPPWRVVGDLVSLIHLSVTATALALYYLIYCYMQLVYYLLKSAVYFHQADGSMKITIAVVTITTLIIGIYLIWRMERALGYR